MELAAEDKSSFLVNQLIPVVIHNFNHPLMRLKQNWQPLSFTVQYKLEIVDQWSNSALTKKKIEQLVWPWPLIYLHTLPCKWAFVPNRETVHLELYMLQSRQQDVSYFSSFIAKS